MVGCGDKVRRRTPLEKRRAPPIDDSVESSTEQSLPCTTITDLVDDFAEDTLSLHQVVSEGHVLEEW